MRGGIAGLTSFEFVQVNVLCEPRGKVAQKVQYLGKI
jgi:hypothetical protein